MEIAIVGGSLGGLTAGCLLADDGHDVTIYERSPTHLEERGAGIALLPMTSRYLRERADVEPSSIAVSTNWIRSLRRDGSVAHAAQHQYVFSSWNTVYREMLRRFDSDRYLLDHELVSIEVATPRLEFAGSARSSADRRPAADENSGNERHERYERHEQEPSDRSARVVTVEPGFAVCADGVASTARSILLPGSSPEYSGYVGWRGVVPETDLSDAARSALDDAITYYVYANSHILVYPIPGRDGSVDRGERLINFVWYRNYQAGDDLDHLLVDRNGHQRDVSVPPGALTDDHVAEARAVAAARLPGCIAEVVDAVDELFIQVVYDMEVDRMVVGRAALIGDAAFSVRPHAAAGTAKAAADAWTLRDAIAAYGDDLDAAAAAWEPPQLELGRSLLARTRAIGRRSQFDDSWVAGDPDLIFGLYAPGN